jgi:hypothetical protein
LPLQLVFVHFPDPQTWFSATARLFFWFCDTVWTAAATAIILSCVFLQLEHKIRAIPSLVI